VSDLLRASFEALDGVWIPLALLFYFLTGYLIVSMLFLAIGSLSDSMQEAQSYLMPVLMVVMFPVIFVMQAAITGPDSLFVKVLSWIPLYAPFAMLARLGTGVSLIEVIGTGVMIAAFVALELFVLGRLFQASVLSAGKPSLRDIFARVATRPAKG
jgi:ABC-2 type transport system permease protein